MSVEQEPQLQAPEAEMLTIMERILGSAIDLGAFEDTCRFYGLGALSFKRTSSEPDDLVHSIINDARRFRELQSGISLNGQ